MNRPAGPDLRLVGRILRMQRLRRANAAAAARAKRKSGGRAGTPKKGESSPLLKLLAPLYLVMFTAIFVALVDMVARAFDGAEAAAAAFGSAAASRKEASRNDMTTSWIK